MTLALLIGSKVCVCVCVLTRRVRLLALYHVDEHIRHVVQLAHALWVEPGGGVVRQPDGADRGVAERLRGHYLVQLPVQILADRSHAIRQAVLAADRAPHEHERREAYTKQKHRERRRRPANDRGIHG